MSTGRSTVALISCAMGFGTADNNVGVDYAPGYMRAAAIALAGG